MPPERLPKERRPVAIFGLSIAHWEHPIDLSRLFMARFGDIARFKASGRDVRVTLKSGTVFDLDRFSASDFDDGVRVWDSTRSVADDSLRIRAIELLPTPAARTALDRLHGTVHSGTATTSPASYSGIGKSASAPTNSPPVSTACVSTPSDPSRDARTKAP